MRHIEEALKAGCNLHVFRSGGGLRIAYIEDKNEDLKGYGEHPNLLEALEHLDEDCAAGGRDYKDVYGEDKIHTHYLTGTHETDCKSDEVILQGGTMDVRHDGSDFIVELKNMEHHCTPRDVVDRVTGTGVSETHTDRGYTYETHRQQFPGGLGCTTKCLAYPEGVGDDAKSSIYDVVRKGRGQSFETARKDAEEAQAVEVI